MTLVNTITSNTITSNTPSPRNLSGAAPSPTDSEEHAVDTTSHLRIDAVRGAAVEPREPDSPAPPGAAPTRTPVARCADGHGTMTGLFFSDNIVDIARAKAMCGLCPLQASCLAGALEREEPWGVWGGELLSGGRIIANKRACGRPPKHPRPEVVIDELGPVVVVA